RRARTALAGLAVPAHGEIGGLGGLVAVDDVEDDLPVVHLDREVLQAGAVHVPAPHLEAGLVAALSYSSSSARSLTSSSFSKRASRSGRMGSVVSRGRVMWPRTGSVAARPPVGSVSRHSRLTL